jgi:uncharacterized protein YeeX (DUF496 family)
MKEIIRKIIKAIKVLFIIAAISSIAFAGYKIYEMTQPIEYVNNTITNQPTDYDKRVEAKIKESADMWKEKQKVWAEQEVSKEIIKEQEAKLESLRGKEVGL